MQRGSEEGGGKIFRQAFLTSLIRPTKWSSFRGGGCQGVCVAGVAREVHVRMLACTHARSLPHTGIHDAMALALKM